MSPTLQAVADWKQEYAECLERHVQAAAGVRLAPAPQEEDRLERAYELGRRCLAGGQGLVELAAWHRQALRHCGGAVAGGPGADAAAQFLCEALAPFEMTHRGFAEAKLMLRRLHELIENEARRIARSLHDGAGQLLAAVHLQLDLLAAELPAEAREGIQSSRQLLDQVEAQLRDLAHELRPALLDHFGLVPALRALAEGYSQRGGMDVTVTASLGRRLSPAVEAALYRIVQEALINVHKHAQAGQVEIEVRDLGDAVFCRVHDDGAGFDPENLATGAGLGLYSMRERADALGGRAEIRSAPGEGTSVEVAIPAGGNGAAAGVGAPGCGGEG